MSQTGKQKIKGFSLVEILISMGIFSIIITSVVFITLSMINAQKKIQARIFLTQTAQTTLESMSRQLRYGYSYSGSSRTEYENSEAGQTITIGYSATTYNNTASDFNTVCQQYLTGSVTTCANTNILTQIATSSSNSPFILFESQDGNPDSFQDQNAFCVYNNKLYKISSFSEDTAHTGIYSKRCSDGDPMLPDDVYIEALSFDIFSDRIDNPRSPRVRIMMRLKHEDGGTIDIQTTVSQRLVTYF